MPLVERVCAANVRHFDKTLGFFCLPADHGFTISNAVPARGTAILVHDLDPHRLRITNEYMAAFFVRSDGRPLLSPLMEDGLPCSSGEVAIGNKRCAALGTTSTCPANATRFCAIGLGSIGLSNVFQSSRIALTITKAALNDL